MIPVVRLSHSFAVEAVLLGTSYALARFTWPGDKSRTLVRTIVGALSLAVVGAHVAWGGLPYPAAGWGVSASMALLPILTLLTLSLGPAALVLAIQRTASRGLRALERARAAKAPYVPLTSLPPMPAPTKPSGASLVPAPPVVASRRALLGLASLALPAAALGVGVSGFVTGASMPRVRRVRMSYPGLSPELAGLKILQLSDLHLGCTRGLDDLSRFLESAPKADLVVVTGDIAENTDLLAPALELFASLCPRYGAYACLGNHEHFHGKNLARRIAERSAVDLLVNDARSIRIGRSRLGLLGVDDPAWHGGDIRPVLGERLDEAMRTLKTSADFRLLLSHRPEGFDPAHERKIDLVLSGHTHGGQIGFHEKSIGERLWPERYLWGPYARDASRLYTTAGFGDWYPFRPGCPSEAALIELAQG